MKMEFEVRPLNVGDIGVVSEILDKLEFSIKDYMKDVDPNMAADENYIKKIGMEVVFEMANMILRKYHKAQKELDNWFASLIDIDVKEYRKLPINTPIEIIKKLAAENDLADFFKSAVG